MAASRAHTTPHAHAVTTSRRSSSSRTGTIGCERRAPARPTASTRSDRSVNARNGRKFDTTQNSEDFAHLGDNDAKNASTVALSAASMSKIPLDSR